MYTVEEHIAPKPHVASVLGEYAEPVCEFPAELYWDVVGHLQTIPTTHEEALRALDYAQSALCAAVGELDRIHEDIAHASEQVFWLPIDDMHERMHLLVTFIDVMEQCVIDELDARACLFLRTLETSRPMHEARSNAHDERRWVATMGLLAMAERGQRGCPMASQCTAYMVDVASARESRRLQDSAA